VFVLGLLDGALIDKSIKAIKALNSHLIAPTQTFTA
jgi:hypothetical protein